MKSIALALAMMLTAAPALARPPVLSPQLAGMEFLIGRWASERGRVAETGGLIEGKSSFYPTADGSALLRQDQTTLFTADGKPTGGFSQIMLIYTEGGAIKADYIGGNHVIHYMEAKIGPGRSVAFMSHEPNGSPDFRLSYSVDASQALHVRFETVAADGTPSLIAEGEMRRVPEY